MVAYQALHWENVMDVFHLKWFLFFKTAISNEQQTGDCNVAFTTLHCLLLCHVYPAHFRVSFPIGDIIDTLLLTSFPKTRKL